MRLLVCCLSVRSEATVNHETNTYRSTTILQFGDQTVVFAAQLSKRVKRNKSILLTCRNYSRVYCRLPASAEPCYEHGHKSASNDGHQSSLLRLELGVPVHPSGFGHPQPLRCFSRGEHRRTRRRQRHRLGLGRFELAIRSFRSVRRHEQAHHHHHHHRRHRRPPGLVGILCHPGNNTCSRTVALGTIHRPSQRLTP